MDEPNGYYTFHWNTGGATEVFVTGSFDDWTKSVKLTRNKDGNGFSATVKLPRHQKVLYKYVVDGNWMTHYNQRNELDSMGYDINCLYPEDIRPVRAETAAVTASEDALPNDRPRNYTENAAAVPPPAKKTASETNTEYETMLSDILRHVETEMRQRGQMESSTLDQSSNRAYETAEKLPYTESVEMTAVRTVSSFPWMALFALIGVIALVAATFSSGAGQSPQGVNGKLVGKHIADLRGQVLELQRTVRSLRSDLETLKTGFSRRVEALEAASVEHKTRPQTRNEDVFSKPEAPVAVKEREPDAAVPYQVHSNPHRAQNDTLVYDCAMIVAWIVAWGLAPLIAALYIQKNDTGLLFFGGFLLSCQGVVFWHYYHATTSIFGFIAVLPTLIFSLLLLGDVIRSLLVQKQTGPQDIPKVLVTVIIAMTLFFGFLFFGRILGVENKFVAISVPVVSFLVAILPYLNPLTKLYPDETLRGIWLITTISSLAFIGVETVRSYILSWSGSDLSFS